jgi:hypothetical protein
MGKGGFFKKDIKERKQKRKERSIKQRILEQKKKVEEKIHHVIEVATEVKKSSEPEPVVEKVEEVRPEPVVEKVEEVRPEPVVEKVEEVRPEPVVEKTQYLIFDQSIISYIMLDNRQVIEGIQNFSENEIKLLTFDAVINDFIEKEKLTYNRSLTFEQILTKLNQIGNFQYYGVDENSEITKRANVLFQAEKYVDDSNILEEEKLSKTDCVIIELLIDKSVVLVTNNSLLKEATMQEAKERNVTVDIFDPLEL